AHGERRRPRDRSADPIACAASRPRPALGAARGAASHQETRAADGAARRRAPECARQDRDLRGVRQYRHAEPLQPVRRSAARCLGHRRGRRRRRPVGARARAGDPRALDALIARARAPEIAEVILALNATVDGQTTAHYITDLLQDANVKVTKLAHGVPVGGELDYLDEGTLAAAIRSRTAF